MENETNKKEIIAKKLAEGKVEIRLNGSGGDVLEMLAMIQRSVAIMLMKKGAPPSLAGITLIRYMEMGLKMAVKDWSEKSWD